jgi:hypothetical protein
MKDEASDLSCARDAGASSAHLRFTDDFIGVIRKAGAEVDATHPCRHHVARLRTTCDARYAFVIHIALLAIS